MKKKVVKTNAPLYKVVAINVIGVVGLIFLTTGSFALTNYVSSIIKLWKVNDYLHYLGGGICFGVCFIFISILFSYTVKKPIDSLLKVSARDINKAVNRMNYVFYGVGTAKGNKGDIPIKGILEDAEYLLKEKKNEKNIDKIVLGGKYHELQAKFIKTAELTDTKNIELYIVGTMLGTFGESGTGLASEMVKLSKENDNHKPFSKAYFCSPGYQKNSITRSNKNSEKRALYPFSSRVSAGETLLELFKHWDQNNCTIDESIVIYLTFVERRDIFPAIQLWGDQAAMILCSSGTTDRRNRNENGTTSNIITEAMPVALMLKNKPYELYGEEGVSFDINSTLTRIRDHIEVDYNIEGNIEKEEWELNFYDKDSKPNITIRNYKLLQEEEELVRLVELSKKYSKRIKTIKKYLLLLANSDKEPLGIRKFEEIISLLKEITFSLSRNT
ncbi:MAG: hypothetical protein JXR05_17110 [Flavobacteriaceae bacterium]